MGVWEESVLWISAPILWAFPSGPDPWAANLVDVRDWPAKHSTLALSIIQCQPGWVYYQTLRVTKLTHRGQTHWPTHVYPWGTKQEVLPLYMEMEH